MNQDFQVSRIDNIASLEAINRSEIDIQIATAKQYPRDVRRSINQIVDIATATAQTAAECFYSLRRQDNVIEGPSVRLAEIVATCWGNLRAASRIIGNDGKHITAQGLCIDLENNVGITCDIKRKITDRNGRTFSDDMQVMTGNAAGAIALRNAIFKVVPKAVISTAITEIKSRLTDSVAASFEDSLRKVYSYFARLGVTKDMILFYFGAATEKELTAEYVAELRTVATAIREGSATVKELFIDPYNNEHSVHSKASASFADKLSAAKQAQSPEGEYNSVFENEL